MKCLLDAFSYIFSLSFSSQRSSPGAVSDTRSAGPIEMDHFCPPPSLSHRVINHNFKLAAALAENHHFQFPIWWFRPVVKIIMFQEY
jgi:hypothetical protein